jgi:hypothetical protein
VLRLLLIALRWMNSALISCFEDGYFDTRHKFKTESIDN